MTDSDEKLAKKDMELQYADRIFVASKFTADTLKRYKGSLAPIEVIPYGFPKVVGERNYDGFTNNRKLRLLFVGRLEQRKGISHLFEAVEKLGRHVELTVVGMKATNDCEILNVSLGKHNYIPSLPHAEILKVMKEHDILLFPSLFEGFGLVITEAMSQGTPVITTERTAGPDLITHNMNGWLVKAGSTDSLVEVLEQILDHPEQVIEAGKLAREAAKLRPWEVYGSELANAVMEHTNSAMTSIS
jgi:glycosyltransferase involved in cell wall biosynthesis